MVSSQFRIATQEDAEIIAQIVTKSYKIAEGHFIEGDRTDTNDVLNLMRKEDLYFLVLMENTQIIGSILVDVDRKEKTGHFGMLAVSLDHQGKGYAAKLIQHAENFVKENGCNKMGLSIVSVRPTLVTFYGKFGYKLTGETEPFPVKIGAYGALKVPYVEMILLEKDL